jgi:uncharacterized membrane protein YdcZ (DUF606 family)
MRDMEDHHMKSSRRRMWIEIGLAIGSVILLVLTLVNGEWIEELFGVEPDAGSGILEWALTLGLLGATIVLGSMARGNARRARGASETA